MNSPKLNNIQNIKAAQAAGRVFLDFFVHTSSISALAPAASLPDSVNIQADSAFILDKIAVFADIAGAAQTAATKVVPLVTIQITDTGSGRQLQQGAMPLPNIAGNGELPFVLTEPRVFVPNSVIQITYTNFDAAATYNIRLSLIGRKVFQL